MADLSAVPEPLRAPSPPERVTSPTPNSRAIGAGIAFGFGCALLVLFAGAWVWQVGHRGLFVLDESIVFDGAWRVYQGQVPYRDFVMPFGPMTFWLQALAFRVAGVDFSSLVLTASLLSLLATAVALRLTFVLSGGSRTWSLLGGLLTAVWYAAPFGVPWMEQTAFFFDLLALLCVVEGRFATRFAAAWFAVAGAMSAFAVLSKQNAGGLFIVVCAGALALPLRAGNLRRTLVRLASYASGGASVALAFGVWLGLRSSPATFLHYWLAVSAGVGWERVAYWKILGTLTFQPLLGSSIVLFIASSLIGTAALIRAHAAPSDSPPDDLRTSLCGFLCLALPQFHAFFQLTTNNDAPNNNAFVGVCVACMAALLTRALAGAFSVRFLSPAAAVELSVPRAAWRTVLLLLTGVALYSVGEGLTLAWTRNVQEFLGASFVSRLEIPGARRLVWGDPTRITPQFCSNLGEMCKLDASAADRERPEQFLNKADLEGIAAELAQRNRNFFVFPDTTILYGLLGKPSPQPLLYFHPGQSYALADQAALDRQIVRALDQNSVELVVLERASFMGTHKLLRDFPILAAWLDRNFVPARELGNYRLFERAKR